jgi:hypothetical protein
VSFIRLRQRRKVDLPQPDGPMKAVTSKMSIETSLSASVIVTLTLRRILGAFLSA